MRFLTVTALALMIFTTSAFAEDILQKIERTGTVTMGFREGSLPFGYINAAGEWVGFGIDLGQEIVNALETKLNKPI
ncbi:MAG: ABC transporter substrate-binding protein, partial [Desulfobacterium sp.]|nr:ABC transporter substrate-binding protein [Desulfobacterium sp.]